MTDPPIFIARSSPPLGYARSFFRPSPTSKLLRHSSFGIRHSAAILLLCAAAATLLPGCYERVQTAVINPDGSGKMYLETMVTIPSQAPPGKAKPTPLAFGRQLAADLINNSRGAEAWAGLAVAEVDATRAKIAAIVYFKDLNALRFDQTLMFAWKRDIQGATLSIERAHTTVRAFKDISDAELDKLVAQAQEDYQDKQQKVLQIQLEAYKLDMTFTLPGEISSTQIFENKGHDVSLTLDGKKAIRALNDFMADRDALRATFRAGRDLPANDDIMLAAMYGKKGPIAARVEFAPDAKPAFDYRTEVLVAQLQQSEMLKNAGVQLVQPFIVTTSSKPATQPATRAPARER